MFDCSIVERLLIGLDHGSHATMPAGIPSDLDCALLFHSAMEFLFYFDDQLPSMRPVILKGFTLGHKRVVPIGFYDLRVVSPPEVVRIHRDRTSVTTLRHIPKYRAWLDSCSFNRSVLHNSRIDRVFGCQIKINTRSWTRCLKSTQFELAEIIETYHCTWRLI